jgi:hypothetical protein
VVGFGSAELAEFKEVAQERKMAVVGSSMEFRAVASAVSTAYLKGPPKRRVLQSHT